DGLLWRMRDVLAGAHKTSVAQPVGSGRSQVGVHSELSTAQGRNRAAFSTDSSLVRSLAFEIIRPSEVALGMNDGSGFSGARPCCAERFRQRAQQVGSNHRLLADSVAGNVAGEAMQVNGAYDGARHIA